MKLKNGTNQVETLIIGAGPAGTGLLVNAMQRGELSKLLDTGICIIDRSRHIGRGTLGKYIVNSDTNCNTFLECLNHDQNEVTECVRQSSACKALEPYRGGPVPLQLVGDFMAALGDSLRSVIDGHPHSQFIPQVTAQNIQMLPDGSFQIRLISEALPTVGAPFELIARNLVTAMGASQSRERTLSAEILPGLSLAGRYAENVC